MSASPWLARAIFEVRRVPTTPLTQGLAGNGSAGGWTVCGVQQTDVEANVALFRADIDGVAAGTTILQPFSVIPVGGEIFGVLRTDGARSTCAGVSLNHPTGHAATTPAIFIDDGVAGVRAFALYSRPGG
jgi:hypothetical protein